MQFHPGHRVRCVLYDTYIALMRSLADPYGRRDQIVPPAAPASITATVPTSPALAATSAPALESAAAKPVRVVSVGIRGRITATAIRVHSVEGREVELCVGISIFVSEG